MRSGRTLASACSTTAARPGQAASRRTDAGLTGRSDRHVRHAQNAHRVDGTGGKPPATTIPNPCPVLAARNRNARQGFVPRVRGVIPMLMMKERRPAFRTIEGWARSVLLEAGATHECEEHGWMRDRSDPHARERALLVARQDPPPGVSPDEAVAAVRDVLDTIGDTCPECPPNAP